MVGLSERHDGSQRFSGGFKFSRTLEGPGNISMPFLWVLMDCNRTLETSARGDSLEIFPVINLEFYVVTSQTPFLETSLLHRWGRRVR
jgi:hypothetical protein